jgi:hypothetical protein
MKDIIPDGKILVAGKTAQIIVPNQKIEFDPGELGIILGWELKDKYGKILNRGEQKAHSFVQQFLQLFFLTATYRGMYPQIPGMGKRNVVNTSGAVIAEAAQDYRGVYNPFGYASAPSGNNSYGTVVGTGQAAPAVTDYALGTIVANGTGAGQLQYSAVSFGAPSNTASLANFVISRDFTNAYASSLTIYEAGVYIWWNFSGNYYMILHDLINSPSGVTIANAQTIALHYKLQTSI